MQKLFCMKQNMLFLICGQLLLDNIRVVKIYVFVFWRMWKSSKSFKHYRIYQYAILPRIPGSDASVFMECFRRSWLHCDNQGSAYNLFLHKLKWPGLFNGERYKIFDIECDARNETFVFWQGYFKDRDACKKNECFDRNTTDTWLVLFLNFLKYYVVCW